MRKQQQERRSVWLTRWAVHVLAVAVILVAPSRASASEPNEERTSEGASTFTPEASTPDWPFNLKFTVGAFSVLGAVGLGTGIWTAVLTDQQLERAAEQRDTLSKGSAGCGSDVLRTCKAVDSDLTGAQSTLIGSAVGFSIFAVSAGVIAIRVIQWESSRPSVSIVPFGQGLAIRGEF